MAELIAPDEIMFKAFQPKVANRFIMTIDGIPSFICKSVGRPNINIEAKKWIISILIEKFNEKLNGKM